MAKNAHSRSTMEILIHISVQNCDENTAVKMHSRTFWLWKSFKGERKQSEPAAPLLSLTGCALHQVVHIKVQLCPHVAQTSNQPVSHQTVSCWSPMMRRRVCCFSPISIRFVVFMYARLLSHFFVSLLVMWKSSLTNFTWLNLSNWFFYFFFYFLIFKCWWLNQRSIMRSQCHIFDR